MQARFSAGKFNRIKDVLDEDEDRIRIFEAVA
jgi:hypothetical protein